LDGGDSGSDAPPVNCPSGKEPKDDPTCVTNDVGVFVSAGGNDANAGTKEKPLATLGAALTKAGTAGKGKIFVCEGSYTESVEIKATVGVYGGFKCADWTYSGTKPKFAGAKPDYVVKVDGASGVTLADLELDGKDGAVGTGQSSIGLFVAGATGAIISRIFVSAGQGASGPGGTLNAFSFPQQTDLDGNAADGGTAGPAKAVACPGGKPSTGGKGGDGAGGDGDNGAPAGDGGAKGLGGAQSIPCTIGGDGSNGLSGKDAVAAPLVGDLTNLGWQPSSGASGLAGEPGQGGGGGGGRTFNAVSGGGGSGGGGGCGGAPGGGGTGGGASIAIAVLNSSLSISSSEAKAASAGNGGAGIGGQAGQTPGGFPGAGKSAGCAGGNGGVGGKGGAGSGGAGGISVGILYKGTKPTTDAATDGKITVGTKGNKGIGGVPGTNDGIDGVAQAVLQAP
jgi:hypothetical protein